MENLDKIRIDHEDAGIRIDQFLADYYEDISRSKLSKLIKDKNVLVNEASVKPSYLIKEDDQISINLKALELKELEGQDLGLEAIYEDKDLAIYNKPYNMLTHPTNYIRENTLVNHLLYKYENLPLLNGKDRPGIVHRLDKDTSGLIIVALNEESMLKLKDMFKSRQITKKYRAIVNGGFSEDEFVLEFPIGRSLRNRKLMSVREDGRYAKTSIKVLESKDNYSLLDINLHTGRTHQIRVHLSHISNPILGDKDYNNIKSNYNIESQLLQAYYLEFDHPNTGEKHNFEIDPYPEFVKYYNIIFEGEKWINNS